MTITNGYCALTDIKPRLGIATANTDDDTILEQVITAVSRLIDERTGRRFFVNSADEIRYFTAEFNDFLRTGDLVSITSLYTDDSGNRTYGTLWTTADYDLEPDNAALDSIPYNAIAISPVGSKNFPVGIRKGVKITGKFGWTAVPAIIKEVCLIQSTRIFKRKDTPFGIAGAAELGQITIPKFDSDVELLLRPFKIWEVGAI
jgi:hypothetical protein